MSNNIAPVMNTIGEIRRYLLGREVFSVQEMQEFKDFWTSLTEDEKLDYKYTKLED